MGIRMINKTLLLTAGPTYEPIDPVRFIGNRSSGKQGIAVAKVFAEEGFKVYLVVGPVNEYLLKDLPDSVEVIRVQTAREMLEASLQHINVDIAIHTAAVSDYRPETIFDHKIKKGSGITLNDVKFVENPDILATFSKHPNRPKLVIGFAAETNNLIENAKAKLDKKGCDYIIANDVSNGKGFGKDVNKLYIVSKNNIVETEETDKYLTVKKLLEVLKNDKVFQSINNS